MRAPVMRWVANVVRHEQPQPPILEVGARIENGTARQMFPQAGYLAMDKMPGLGVDLIMDILVAADEVRGRFETVLVTEVLEHITEPWRAIEIMHDALVPGGLFIATWCFAFPIHAAPADYWRVTPSGFEHLLRRAGFVGIKIETEGCGRPADAPRHEADWQYPVGVFAIARRRFDPEPPRIEITEGARADIRNAILGEPTLREVSDREPVPAEVLGGRAS